MCLKLGTVERLLLALAISVFLSFNEPMEMGGQHYNLEALIEFSVFNSQNGDLLDPKTVDNLDVADIRIFYVIDDKIQEVFEQGSDYPRKFMLYKHENEYRVRVFLNDTKTSDRSITYIQWTEGDRDTVEVFYKRTPNATLQEKIWLNGKPIWERGENAKDPYFKLMK